MREESESGRVKLRLIGQSLRTTRKRSSPALKLFLECRGRASLEFTRSAAKAAHIRTEEAALLVKFRYASEATLGPVWPA